MMKLLPLRVVRHLVIPLKVTGFLVLSIHNNIFSAWNATATWGGWGSWSECSQSCDEGSKRRERQCLYEDGVVAASSQLCDRCQTDDISCSDGSIEYERCNEGVCSGSTGMCQSFPSEIVCLPHSIRLGVFLSISQSVSLGKAVIVPWNTKEEFNNKR